eukprot:4519346-Pleurochrysis_carterae.AAC.1
MRRSVRALDAVRAHAPHRGSCATCICWYCIHVDLMVVGTFNISSFRYWLANPSLQKCTSKQRGRRVIC